MTRLRLDENGRERMEEIYEQAVRDWMEVHDATQSIYRWLNPMYNLHPGGLGEYSVLTRTDYDRLSRRESMDWARIEDQYFVDVRAAYPEQADEVDWLARAHRRSWLARAVPSVPGMRYAGVDLIQLSESVLGEEDPFSRPGLAAALKQFDMEMESALVHRRDVALRNPLQRIAGLMEAGDRKGMVRAYEEWSMPSVHIRNLSLKHLPLIATHLEPDERHAFEAKFEELLYHDLYAPARVDLLLGKGLKRDDLTDAQRSRLQAIAASIEVKRSAERARLKQMQDERSSEAGTRRWAEHRTEMLLSGQGTRMSPEDISYHNELLPAYRAVGSEFEEEILRILGEEGE